MVSGGLGEGEEQVERKVSIKVEEHQEEQHGRSSKNLGQCGDAANMAARVWL